MRTHSAQKNLAKKGGATTDVSFCEVDDWREMDELTRCGSVESFRISLSREKPARGEKKGDTMGRVRWGTDIPKSRKEPIPLQGARPESTTRRPGPDGK